MGSETNELANVGEDGTLYLAGQRVPAGIYQQVGTHRKIRLEAEDCLPASLDGHIACYLRVIHLWHQHQEREEAGLAE